MMWIRLVESVQVFVNGMGMFSLQARMDICGEPGQSPLWMKSSIQNIDPVYSSLVVSQEKEIYYIYYTTDGPVGEGFCYQYQDNSLTEIWEKDAAYALQGMPVGAGFLVCMDKSNKLHVIK